jgi:hypothetical protein
LKFVPVLALLAILLVGATSQRSVAIAASTAPKTPYHDRIVKAVNAVHAAQRRLHKPRTPFGRHYSYLQWRVWGPRAAKWRAHVMDPHWIIPAVFGKHAAATALCIARAESGLNPHAYNPSSAAGLYQLESFWYNGSSSFHWKFNPFDRWQNTLHAHLLYAHDHGWRQWYGDPCVS